jgi:hypothetical protein
MKTLLCTAFLALAAALHAGVIRSAPDFTWIGAGGQARSLKSLRGQPVVLLIADSPRAGAFNAQVARLEEIFQNLSSKRVVFAAAFRHSDDRPVKSNIPFVIAASGSEVASVYHLESKFGIAIIGRDGNLDLFSEDVVSAERVRDIIINSFEVQKALRR